MQFSILLLASLQLVASMIITSPKFGDVIHRDQLFEMKWTLSTNVKDDAEYRFGVQQGWSTWLVQDGLIPVHTDKLSQTFWGALFPKPGEYAIVLYRVGSQSGDVPAWGSEFFTVV